MFVRLEKMLNLQETSPTYLILIHPLDIPLVYAPTYLGFQRKFFEVLIVLDVCVHCFPDDPRCFDAKSCSPFFFFLFP